MASGNVALSLVAGGATDTAGNPAVAASLSSLDSQGIDTTAPAEALAITAIATDTGTAGDFITSDTTLIVSGSNGALAAGEKIQVSSDGAPGSMSRRSTARTGATTTPPPRTRRASLIRRGSSTPLAISAPPPARPSPSTPPPAEALAITAIATDTGTVGDFITSDTTLIVSGSNGALAAGEKIQVSSDGATWFDVTPIDSTHWSYDDTATRTLRASPIRRG